MSSSCQIDDGDPPSPGVAQQLPREADAEREQRHSGEGGRAVRAGEGVPQRRGRPEERHQRGGDQATSAAPPRNSRMNTHSTGVLGPEPGQEERRADHEDESRGSRAAGTTPVRRGNTSWPSPVAETRLTSTFTRPPGGAGPSGRRPTAGRAGGSVVVHTAPCWRPQSWSADRPGPDRRGCGRSPHDLDDHRKAGRAPSAAVTGGRRTRTRPTGCRLAPVGAALQAVPHRDVRRRSGQLDAVAAAGSGDAGVSVTTWPPACAWKPVIVGIAAGGPRAAKPRQRDQPGCSPPSRRRHPLHDLQTTIGAGLRRRRGCPVP